VPSRPVPPSSEPEPRSRPVPAPEKIATIAPSRADVRRGSHPVPSHHRKNSGRWSGDRVNPPIGSTKSAKQSGRNGDYPIGELDEALAIAQASPDRQGEARSMPAYSFADD